MKIVSNIALSEFYPKENGGKALILEHDGMPEAMLKILTHPNNEEILELDEDKLAAVKETRSEVLAILRNLLMKVTTP